MNIDVQSEMLLLLDDYMHRLFLLYVHVTTDANLLNVVVVWVHNHAQINNAEGDC